MQPTTHAARPTIVYVGCARSNEIVAFAMNQADGSLEIIQRAPVTDGMTPLAVGPNRGFLYAGLRAEPPSIIAFSIDATTGELQTRGSAPLSDPPMYLATDASGDFLLSASYAGATFAINRIRGDGLIETVPVQRDATPPNPHGIRTDPANRFLFVTALGGDAILQYVFDGQTGRARPNAVPSIATAPGSGPRHLVFHPTADVLYVNGELDGSISSYALERQSGQLAPLRYERMLTGATDVAAPWAAEIAITPDGRYLYASERRTSVLATFDLRGEPGALVHRGLISTEDQPRSFAIGPGGHWLVLAGEKSNHVCVYAVDSSTGELAARHRYPVGDKPVWVTIVEL